MKKQLEVSPAFRLQFVRQFLDIKDRQNYTLRDAIGENNYQLFAELFERLAIVPGDHNDYVYTQARKEQLVHMRGAVQPTGYNADAEQLADIMESGALSLLNIFNRVTRQRDVIGVVEWVIQSMRMPENSPRK